MLNSLRSLITSLAIASVIGSVAQGYASASTQASPGSTARMTTAGIAVDSVDYVTSGSTLAAVTFRVKDPDASLRIRLRSNGRWIPCTNSRGAVSCEATDYPVSAISQLEIVAAS